jgi:Lrp/AsnC family transcriptional regulator, leucine-responsive regulatory protein
MPKNSPLKSRVLDEKDKKILMLLQEDARMQLKDISKKVRLNIDSVHKRIKEMKRKELFSLRAEVNPRKIGFPIVADIKIKLKNVSEVEREKFIKYLQGHKSVTTLLAVMGDYDFTCVLIAKDGDDLEKTSTQIRQKFKELILEWKGLLVLKTYKFEEYDLL